MAKVEKTTIKIPLECPNCGQRLSYLNPAPPQGAYDGVRCPFCSEIYRYIPKSKGHNWLLYTKENPYYTFDLTLVIV